MRLIGNREALETWSEKWKKINSWYISNSKLACNSMRKIVQLFHETLRKSVNQLIHDPQCGRNQAQIESYCQKTTLVVSCAKGEDFKWAEMMFLLQGLILKEL